MVSKRLAASAVVLTMALVLARASTSPTATASPPRAVESVQKMFVLPATKGVTFKVKPFSASCPSGSQATGGGYKVPGPYNATIGILSSYPRSAGEGWTVEAFNGATAARRLTVYALCSG